MPRSSAFIRQLRKHGIAEGHLSTYRSPINFDSHRLEHAPRVGKKRDTTLTLLHGESAQTRALMTADLPRRKSTLSNAELICSNFLRIALFFRPNYHAPQKLRAVAHAEIVLTASSDMDPTDPRRHLMVPTPQAVLTVRLLDLHIQAAAGSDNPSQIVDMVGWAIAGQMCAHLEGMAQGA